MKSYSITEQLAQGILDYLVKQPYGDVYQLIQALQAIQPLPEETAPKDVYIDRGE